ncbi:MAG TPA: hypothetical protein VF111_05030, partial [Thermoanaerobaculia bacterium]
RPNRIILGIEGDGVYISNDRGKTYQRTSDGLHNLRITTIVPDPFEKERVFAAVVFGGAASGIYRSNDAGKTWEKASKSALPEVMSLAIAAEADAEVKFLAATEKGVFWSNDAETWTQSEPSSFPIRVDKIVRFNRSRAFAATAEGVMTTRDGGKSWYRLAGASDRAVDLAVGTWNGGRALYALTANGLVVFDGDKWNTISGAPSKGRTLALRGSGEGDVVFVAGAHGVKAGRIDAERQWQPVDAPDTQYAVVHGGSRSLFLTSRQQREILVGDPTGSDWHELSLPSRNTEVTAVVPDPFARDRYYVGTLGEGVYIYEGKTRRYELPAATRAQLGGSQ